MNWFAVVIGAVFVLLVMGFILASMRAGSVVGWVTSLRSGDLGWGRKASDAVRRDADSPPRDDDWA
jgi:hypothetical protein